MAPRRRNNPSLTVGTSVARNLQRQAERKLDGRSRTARELFIKAEYVRREAEALARASQGTIDRVVRGFVVQRNFRGYPVVTNIAVGDNGYPLGRAWEEGTGIFDPYRRRPITPVNGGDKDGYMVFKISGADLPRVSGGFGRRRRNSKGQFRSLRDGAWVRTRSVDGFKGGHFLGKASQSVARRYGWRYTPRVRF